MATGLCRVMSTVTILGLSYLKHFSFKEMTVFLFDLSLEAFSASFLYNVNYWRVAACRRARFRFL